MPFIAIYAIVRISIRRINFIFRLDEDARSIAQFSRRFLPFSSLGPHLFLSCEWQNEGELRRE